MMKTIKIIPEPDIHFLGKERQHAYLLRVRKMINEGCCMNIPHWLYFVTLAYFSGNTEEIIGTPMMSTYRDILFNQLLP